MILAVDTSSTQGSLALIEKADDKYKLLDEVSWSRSQDKKSSGKHSEVILLRLEEMLGKNKINVNQLKTICVGIGPGRFTGIRVGLCLANSLAYSLDLPIISTDSLNLLASPLMEDKKSVIALVNAQKNQCFVREYGGNKTEESLCLTLLQLEERISEDMICVGDAYDHYQNSFLENLKMRLKRNNKYSDYPEAKGFAYLLNSKPELLNNSQWNSNKALYIKASEAEEKLWKGMLKVPEKII